MNMVNLCGQVLIDLDRVLCVDVFGEVRFVDSEARVSLNKEQKADLFVQFARQSNFYLDAARAISGCIR